MGGTWQASDFWKNPMCGRFTFLDPSSVAEAFGLSPPIPELAPRYNAAPSQTIAVVALKRGAGERRLGLLKWGLVPSWANDPAAGPKPINARADSLDKPTFRDAFRSKRCLIPADGFYEWSTVASKKRATHFRMKNRSLFAFAGLWEFWTDGTEKLATCCIITTDANELVGTIHNRMPAIVPRAAYGAWLSTDTPPIEVNSILAPYPSEEMDALVVGPAVNSPRNAGPECLQPAA